MADEQQGGSGPPPDFDPSRPPSTKEREVLESEVMSVDPHADFFGTAPTMPGGEVEVEHSGRRSDRSGELIHDRYLLLRELGHGGMGTVYLAKHTAILKHFAVKVLNERFLERGDIAERFLQEAQAVSRVTHPNVVSVTDFGRLDDGSTFLVMEHLQGESLATTCKREAPLPWARVRHLMLQICEALQAAHEVQVVHRDIKPDNILRITREDDPDFVKVLDFGLAKLQGGLRLTRTGMVIGTPEYMAPEQARGQPTDHRTDIYSAGIVMYELLCGVVPFKSKSFVGMRNQHLLAPPAPPSRRAPTAALSDEMDAIVLRALAKNPDHRFASMAEMAEAIADVGLGKGPVRLLERPTLQLANLAELSMIDGGRIPRPQRAAEPPPVQVEARAKPRSLWIGLGLGLGALLAAIATVLVILVLREPSEMSEAAVLPGPGADPGQASAADPGQASPTDPGQASPTGPAETERVVLRFVTNAGGPIQVLSASDGQLLGTTDAAGELVIPRTDQALQLLLRAEGFADLPLTLTPDRDRSFEKRFEAAD